jgi:hypothetical protein
VFDKKTDATNSDAMKKPLVKFWYQLGIFEINFDRKGPLDLKLITDIMSSSSFIAERHTKMWTMKFVESIKTL